MVGVRAPLVGLFLVGWGCTSSNPAFDGADAAITPADDDRGDDVADDDGTTADDSAESVSEDASVDGTSDTAPPPDVGDDESESSDGAESCPEMIEYDLELAISELPDGGCAAPLVLYGRVIDAVDDSVVFSRCTDCECASPSNPIEVHAPGLLPLDEFPANACVRFDIEWSPEHDCRPVGFVASSDRIQPLRPVAIAGQDVLTMPQAVGGASIGMSTIDRCECSECCDKSGVASLDFGSGGGPIPEGSEGEVQGLAGSQRTWQVTVYEAHVHDDCSRALAWCAVIDEK